MDFPKCRTCGERHRLGPCPKFNQLRGSVKKSDPRIEPQMATVENSRPAGVAFGPRELKSKSKGRPLEKDRAQSIEARQPWKAAGMSRRTWYRREKEKRDEPPTNS